MNVCLRACWGMAADCFQNIWHLIAGCFRGRCVSVPEEQTETVSLEQRRSSGTSLRSRSTSSLEDIVVVHQSLLQGGGGCGAHTGCGNSNGSDSNGAASSDNHAAESFVIVKDEDLEEPSDLGAAAFSSSTEGEVAELHEVVIEAAAKESVVRLTESKVTDEDIQEFRALGFKSEELLDETKWKERVRRGYFYLRNIIDEKGWLDKFIDNLFEQVELLDVQRTFSSIQKMQEDIKAAEDGPLEVIVKNAIVDVLFNQPSNLEEAHKEALRAATKFIIQDICNCLYQNAKNRFTDGAYRLYGENVGNLIEFLRRPDNGHYRRPSSHLTKETNANEHYGYNLDEGTFLPEDHRHVLFIDYQDRHGNTCLFFKPEHYGLDQFWDAFHHMYEWGLSSLRRYCGVDVGVGAQESKERVKYLDSENIQPILLFFQKMKEPLETEVDEEEFGKMQMVHAVVDEETRRDIEDKVKHFGFAEVAEQVKNIKDDFQRRFGLGEALENHFAPVMGQVKALYPDCEQRIANEVIIEL